MRCLPFVLILVATVARAQDTVVHQWAVLSEDTVTTSYTQVLTYLEDTAHIERAGSKRQVFVHFRARPVPLRTPEWSHDIDYTVMFDCATYQMKEARDYRWQDIDLTPSNVWLKVIKSVCPPDSTGAR